MWRQRKRDGREKKDEIIVHASQLIRTLFNFIVFQDDVGQQRPLRDAWFTVGIQDEAAFYTVLSNSALHLDSMQNGGKRASETTLSTQYYSRAIKSIMKRFHNLSDPGVLDGLIGAITGCMAHAVSLYPMSLLCLICCRPVGCVSQFNTYPNLITVSYSCRIY